MPMQTGDQDGAFTPAELAIMAEAIALTEAMLDHASDSAPELTKLRIAAVVLEEFQGGQRNAEMLATRAVEAVQTVLRGYAPTLPRIAGDTTS